MVISSFGTLPGRPARSNPYFTTTDGGTTWANLAGNNLLHGDTTAGESGMAYVALLGMIGLIPLLRRRR